MKEPVAAKTSRTDVVYGDHGSSPLYSKVLHESAAHRYAGTMGGADSASFNETEKSLPCSGDSGDDIGRWDLVGHS